MQYFGLFRVSRQFNDGCTVPLRSNFEKFRASFWPAWLERSFCDFAAYESVETDSEGGLSERASSVTGKAKKSKRSVQRKKSVVDFRKIDAGLLPTVVLVGRPNVGKSALFNRCWTQLGLRRLLLPELSRTADMTCNVLRRCQFALFLIDVRDGLQPLDHEVGKWMRKNAAGIRIVLVINKSESLDDLSGVLIAAAGEAQALGFGEPIPISAETGLGMVNLYEALCPLLEEYMLKKISEDAPVPHDEVTSPDASDKKVLPLQLAIVGRPNVGKSTLLNALLQQERVLVGPEAGLTRDSIRAEFKYEGRTVYLVDTAGWMQRAGQEKGPSSLSIIQSKKNLMRGHVVALVLDAQEIAKAKCSMNHAEVLIAPRQAVEEGEGRGLVVIVNKMDLLSSKKDSELCEKVRKAVPEEIQTVIPQITGIPVVFISALEGKGRIAVMRRVLDTYEKWCRRLSTARLNRWLRKVMSRHSWKDHATQPKIKYFTQVKARPPTFVSFSGKVKLQDTDIRFLTKSLKEDFDMGGIPIRIMQRVVSRKGDDSGGATIPRREDDSGDAKKTSLPRRENDSGDAKKTSARSFVRVGSDKRMS